MQASAKGQAGTRGQIVAAADALFHAQGFERTSFADIAAAVGISRGNFYYHFKSKDEILEAVIGSRREATGRMLECWQVEGGDAPARLRSFIRMLVDNRAAILARGCPVGTLSAELVRLGHRAVPSANDLLLQFRAWLQARFEEAGLAADDAARAAMHLLARSQGVALLANVFNDEAFLQQEVAALEAWLEGRLQAGP